MIQSYLKTEVGNIWVVGWIQPVNLPAIPIPIHAHVCTRQLEATPASLHLLTTLLFPCLLQLREAMQTQFQLLSPGAAHYYLDLHRSQGIGGLGRAVVAPAQLTSASTGMGAGKGLHYRCTTKAAQPMVDWSWIIPAHSLKRLSIPVRE